jgi:hypothetical protein
VRRAVLVALVLGAAAASAWPWLRAPGRTLYVGGPILTLDAGNRVAEALLVDGERIAAVGAEAELRARAGRARVVDLAGRALLPGFVEAHGHFPGAGLAAVFADLNAPPIGDVAALDALVARLAERAARAGAGEWVVGVGYDDTLLAEHRHPTRADLDRVSTRHPVAAWHVSGHLAALNSAGLAAVGYGRDTPDPPGGRIRRDAGGEPTGVLEETAAEPLQRLYEPGPLDALRIVRRAVQVYAAAGVTTAQNGYATRSQMRGLAWLSRLGIVPLRLVLWPGAEAADAMQDGSFRFRSYDPRWLRVGAVKLVADGSIQGYTGWLSEPYHVAPGDDPGHRGYPTLAPDELARAVTRYHSAGLQVAVHGNGDAAIDAVLDAFEAAQRAAPRPDARPIVVHAQMTRDDQLERMRAGGVVPSFFSLHTYYWGDRHRAIFLGPERAARISPARGAQERGVRFTLHCDTPVVPIEPLRLAWSAVNRRTTTGYALGPQQRIDVASALRAITVDAAWQHFEEADKGSLEPGKLADLVILDRSPFDAPEALDRIRVLETIVGGRTIFRAEGGR